MERREHDPTPSGRLAAVVVDLIREYSRRYNREVDFADVAAALHPYVRIEILTAERDLAIKLGHHHVGAELEKERAQAEADNGGK